MKAREYRGGGRTARIEQYSNPGRGWDGYPTKTSIARWSKRAEQNSPQHSFAVEDPTNGKPRANLDVPVTQSTGKPMKLHDTCAPPRIKRT
jgi:hypothetical protein